MAKNAIVFRNKAASRYHASRPCHLLLADGTQAGITATKMASAGSTLLGLFAPDGSTDAANWKTAPVSGGARHTTYGCLSGAPAIGSVVGWFFAEVPHQLWFGVETAGPLESQGSFMAGEVLLAHDTTLGESSTYGNADGRTIYGMLTGQKRSPDTSTGILYDASSNQGRVFFGAESTTRQPVTRFSSENYTATDMSPASYGTGDWIVQGEHDVWLRSSYRVGKLAHVAWAKQGAHWATRSVNGVTCRLVGHSVTAAYGLLCGYRKPGATHETPYFRRTGATYASWTDLLQAAWNDAPNLAYWEQDSSA
ncbi:MAG: hypothetical protein FJ102_26230 [Deltaproteobacteria bacterium]|nr:hypothetical protein [Deltaproteobacteria bacterium]